MQVRHRFVIPRTGQVVDLALEIDVDAVAEEMAKRAVMNKSWESQAMYGAIKAVIVETKED